MSPTISGVSSLSSPPSSPPAPHPIAQHKTLVVVGRPWRSDQPNGVGDGRVAGDGGAGRARPAPRPTVQHKTLGAVERPWRRPPTRRRGWWEGYRRWWGRSGRAGRPGPAGRPGKPTTPARRRLGRPLSPLLSLRHGQTGVSLWLAGQMRETLPVAAAAGAVQATVP